MTRILFRVDANPTVGLGHLQRCISLAKALESIDVESVFLACDHLETITRIQRFGFEVCELTISDLWNEQDSAFTVDLAFEHECDAIVVDSYLANSEYISNISQPILYSASYYEKQKIIEQLFQEKKLLIHQLDLIDKKNSLLTDVIDTDYLEILYRKKFMVGKSNEHIYKSN